MKPTLFGYGLTTKAIAKKLGGECIFFDDNCQESYKDDMGNTIHPSHLFNPDKSQLEVTTPSLPPRHPLIQRAKNLLSEYDYFLTNPSQIKALQSNANPNSSLLTHSSPKRHKPFTIWISGTNGKTTTTQMLTHILKKRGAVSGGNIGTPLAELDTNAPIWILESSSFTLHHTNMASPDIYLLLPITPDHIDWHGSFESYASDKLKPLLTMREGELALIPKGLSTPATDAYVVEYENNDFICDYFNLDSSKLHYKGAFLQDALLSLAITKTLFDEADYDLLNNFKRDAHRQEEFYDAQNRLWVNDSKATNLDATVQALKGYANKPIHLILGGDDKGIDLIPLFVLLRTMDVILYAIGANTEKLYSLAQKYGIKIIKSHNIHTAVSRIDKNLTTEQVALLSPAAASFDQFSSYRHRGETFVNLVKKLKK